VVATTAAHAFRLALFVGLPASALLFALARPIVVAVFARGAFDAVSVDGTTAALMVQGLGVVFVAMVRQLVPLYYALGDTRTPVIISGIDLLAFIGIALTLRGPLGHVGVSWAVTGSSLVQLGFLMALLRKRLPELKWSMIGRSTATATAAAIAAGAAGYAAARFSPFGGLVPAALGGIAFLIVYVAVCRMLGNEELAEISGGLSRRLRRRR
jgi:putative peptidoglycan lipid II flippase